MFNKSLSISLNKQYSGNLRSNMYGLIFLLLLIYEVCSEIVVNDKEEFCDNLICDQDFGENVCGMRAEGEGFRLRVFQNECQLLKFGCDVGEDTEAYGIVNIKYCKTTFPDYFNKHSNEVYDLHTETSDLFPIKKNPCSDYDCSNNSGGKLCGIRQEGIGFKVRLFSNNCERLLYNCETKLDFYETDLYICNGLEGEDNSNNDDQDGTEIETEATTNMDTEPTKQAEVNNKINGNSSRMDIRKSIVVMDGSMLDFNGDINETMDNFFAGTHVFDLPVREVRREEMNETSRRMMLNIAGPVKVFKPWILIPKNISTDRMHEPTLSSCYHKCPKVCPDTYAPVCGVPGIVAREPSLMFKNHCFMDVAQCKMRWEDKSDTAISSSYIESSFLICLGDALNGLYRFLPLVRTLQHMGRLKRKGQYHYKIRNMRFFNTLIAREPALMG